MIANLSDGYSGEVIIKAMETIQPDALASLEAGLDKALVDSRLKTLWTDIMMQDYCRMLRTHLLATINYATMKKLLKEVVAGEIKRSANWEKSHWLKWAIGRTNITVEKPCCRMVS